MRKPVVLGAFGAALLLAVLNNLVNSLSIPWIGSPEVLQKPPGWPAEPLLKGFLEGLKEGWKGFLDNGVAIGVGGMLLLIGMFLLNRYRKVPVSSMLRSLLRVGLGLMFLAAARDKFLDPKSFSIAVAQYQFLPALLVNPFSLCLSAFEIVVGVGILVTPWEREFGALLGLMMGMFIIALAQALARGLGIACGCFDIAGAGSLGETWFSLIRDVVLLLPIAWLVATGNRRWIWQAH